jgi:SAM-dependent methyltransferase
VVDATITGERRVARPPSAVAILVRRSLDEALSAVERGGRLGEVTALDAGCGRRSHLLALRPRIDRLVGVDIHPPPDGALDQFDEFRAVDLCTDTEAFVAGTFDVVLSSFTVEHFTDPVAAFRNLHRWLRPGGRLVLSTVNRRHPFVRAYLAAPRGIRGPLQQLVKISAADAHPLVGSCNSVADLRAALAAAGFSEVHIETAGHLSRAWAHRLPTRLLGAIGDALAEPFPSRRSTIVASAVA